MDTGYVNLLTAEERGRVLAYTRDRSQGRRFIAGAFIEGDEHDPATAYLAKVDVIRSHSGTPILFQCSALGQATESQLRRVHARRESRRTAARLRARDDVRAVRSHLFGE